MGPNIMGVDLRVALSTTTIEPLSRTSICDGIGIYTRELYDGLSLQPGVALSTAWFPNPRKWIWGAGSAGRFSLPYRAQAGLAIVTSRPFKAPFPVDIYHATDYQIPKLSRTRVVATLHDSVSLMKPEWVTDLARSYKNMVLRSAASWADLVIAISTAAVPDLVEYFGLSEDRIRVVHNGIAPAWLEVMAEAEISEILDCYNLKPGYILFVGTLQPRKNIAGILAAYEILPEKLRREFPLVLVGKAGWKVEDELARIRHLQAQGQCLWLDYVGHDHLRALYQAASLFLFPSLLEGFGIPVLEAFASGVPVVTSNITSLPEVAGGAAELVDPYNVEEIAAVVEKVLEDRVLAADLVGKGRLRAAAMSWHQTVAETVAVYREIL